MLSVFPTGNKKPMITHKKPIKKICCVTPVNITASPIPTFETKMIVIKRISTLTSDRNTLPSAIPIPKRDVTKPNCSSVLKPRMYGCLITLLIPNDILSHVWNKIMQIRLYARMYSETHSSFPEKNPVESSPGSILTAFGRAICFHSTTITIRATK